jgi:hypothetical protein
MQTYRVYKLNPAGRIVSGDWIEAQDETTARRLAHEMCDAVTPAVELWQGPCRVGVIPCESETMARA